MSSKVLKHCLSPFARRHLETFLHKHARRWPVWTAGMQKRYYEGVEADPTVRGIELLRDPRLNKVHVMVTQRHSLLNYGLHRTPVTQEFEMVDCLTKAGLEITGFPDVRDTQKW